jgi:hypothetical protein
MQLPRGTFLTIKRSIKVGDLLAELHDIKFTGICTVSYGLGNGTFVFKTGKRILAQFKDITGKAACDELQKIIGEKVDASLSTLNETQMQLSLEFNKTCLIVKEGKAENTPIHEIMAPKPGMIKKSLPNTPKPANIVMSKSHQKQGIQEAAATNKLAKVEPVGASELPKIISDTYLKKVAQKPFAAVQQKTSGNVQIPEEIKPENTAILSADSDSSSFEMDIEAFETMDVDTITDKFRGECKTLIKQLHLEHLTDK